MPNKITSVYDIAQSIYNVKNAKLSNSPSTLSGIQQIADCLNSSNTLVSEINELITKGYSINVTDAGAGVSSTTDTYNKIINLGVMTEQNGAGSADLKPGDTTTTSVSTLAINDNSLFLLHMVN